MLFRQSRYLPHLERQNGTYFVTLRLAGSVPKLIIEGWKSEREDIQQNAKRQNRQHTKYEKERLNYLYSKRIENYLDEGYGDCWLKNPKIAQLVIETLKYFDRKRYSLHAWCIMPNHVHVVFNVISTGPESLSDLSPILHSWKSFTAHKANIILSREGKFWQDEYYDHLIVSDEEFAHFVHYTLNNPVKARFCKDWFEWRWTGCSEEIRGLLAD